MAGIFYSASSRSEILDIVDLVKVAEGDRLDVFDYVRIMEAEAIRILNERNK